MSKPEEPKKEKPPPTPKPKWVCNVCHNPKCNGHLGIDV